MKWGKETPSFPKDTQGIELWLFHPGICATTATNAPYGTGRGVRVKQNIAKSVSNWSTASQGRVEMEKHSEGSIHTDYLLSQHLNGVGLCCCDFRTAEELR